MYRLPARIVPAFLLTTTPNYDITGQRRKTLNEMTGWERVKTIYTLDEYGNASRAVTTITNSTFFGVLVGAVYGGVLKSRAAYVEFMETNQATAFKSHLDAKRVLQDKMTISYGTGAFGMAWRVGLFSFVFMSVSNGYSLYRNKEGISEYTIAGLVTGFLFRLHMGVRGVIVGSILGSFLGTVAGVLTYAVLKICGLSFADWKELNYKNKMEQFERKKAVIADAQRDIEMNPEIAHRFEQDEKAKRLLDTLTTLEEIKKDLGNDTNKKDLSSETNKNDLNNETNKQK